MNRNKKLKQTGLFKSCIDHKKMNFWILNESTFQRMWLTQVQFASDPIMMCLKAETQVSPNLAREDRK